MIRAALGVMVAVALGAGCGGEDDRPAVLAYLQPAILGPNCATAGCHSKLTGTYGLQLETIEAAEAYLLDGHLVVPYEPEQSRLLYLLRADEAPRMPPDAPLPEADIALFERWILDGAPVR